MTTLYLLLLIGSALCFGFDSFTDVRSSVRGRANLQSLGLLLFVLVPLIQTARSL